MDDKNLDMRTWCNRPTPGQLRAKLSTISSTNSCDRINETQHRQRKMQEDMRRRAKDAIEAWEMTKKQEQNMHECREREERKIKPRSKQRRKSLKLSNTKLLPARPQHRQLIQLCTDVVVSLVRVWKWP
jgi:alpha-galactosidase/6-phospho-beta-glucosidase family protein